MKRCTFIFLLFCFTNSIFSQSDSTKIKRFRGFYVNSYYPFQIYNQYVNEERYSKEDDYKYEIKNFSFQTPAIGLGYVLNKHPFFIKTDINYWYGTKKLDDYFSLSSNDIDSPEPRGGSVPPGFNTMKIGDRYYKMKDHITGTLNLHYIDIGFAMGGNLSPNIRLFAGWRANVLKKYNYKAKLDREASQYQVIGFYDQYWTKDSLVAVENVQYKDHEIKALSGQDFSSNVYFDTGISVNFKIGKQLFLADLMYETNRTLFQSYGAMSKYVTFRLAYVFYYKTYFGKKLAN
jgi:hypothetical protein